MTTASKKRPTAATKLRHDLKLAQANYAASERERIELQARVEQLEAEARERDMPKRIVRLADNVKHIASNIHATAMLDEKAAPLFSCYRELGNAQDAIKRLMQDGGLLR